jgi:hypothetical protein
MRVIPYCCSPFFLLISKNVFSPIDNPFTIYLMANPNNIKKNKNRDIITKKAGLSI